MRPFPRSSTWRSDHGEGVGITAAAFDGSLPTHDDRILSRLTTARRTLLRVVTAAALVLVVVLVGRVGQVSSQAWTLEQSIAATRPMRGLHLSGTLDGRVGVENLGARGAGPVQRGGRPAAANG